MLLDEPGDPYRCCIPGCRNRSRAHLCRRCYASHADPAGLLPPWLLALQREANRQAMARSRAFRRGVDTDFTTGDFANAVDPASEGWEDGALEDLEAEADLARAG